MTESSPFVHVRVRLKGKRNWTEGEVTNVFTFRSRRIIERRSFADRDQALEWATKGKVS